MKGSKQQQKEMTADDRKWLFLINGTLRNFLWVTSYHTGIGPGTTLRRSCRQFVDNLDHTESLRRSCHRFVDNFGSRWFWVTSQLDKFSHTYTTW